MVWIEQEDPCSVCRGIRPYPAQDLSPLKHWNQGLPLLFRILLLMSSIYQKLCCLCVGCLDKFLLFHKTSAFRNNDVNREALFSSFRACSSSYLGTIESQLESLILVLLCPMWLNFESDYKSGLVLLNVIVAQDICTCL